jgi:kynurenine 3-monooxygenase
VKPKNVAVVGGGLVGSLLSIYLAKRGCQVTVFDRRIDLRTMAGDEGRSINLALSNRGIAALKEIGVMDKIEKMAIPMHGRIMHDLQGKLSYQPYGKEGQFINSITRNSLNSILIDEAEALGVNFYFQHRCTHVDLQKTAIMVLDQAQAVSKEKSFDYIIGADGAFSSVRKAMQITDRFDYSQYYIEHGYKELTIPPLNDTFALEKNALHIWPRESFMLIALPNYDGSFTCTLFFPFEGDVSFEALKTDDHIRKFFKDTFPDAAALMPNLVRDFKMHPTASLVTVKCFPWVKNKTLIIGDAAHAIVPFYGQGMNAGFEDCRILNQLLDKHEDHWDKALSAFQGIRKPDVDAIAQLALDNFVEMRDHVADANFLLRKKIEAFIHDHYPEQWIPLYSMVTFYENISYSEACKRGGLQKEIMDKVMAIPDIENNWQNLNFEEIIASMPHLAK